MGLRCARPRRKQCTHKGEMHALNTNTKHGLGVWHSLTSLGAILWPICLERTAKRSFKPGRQQAGRRFMPSLHMSSAADYSHEHHWHSIAGYAQKFSEMLDCWTGQQLISCSLCTRQPAAILQFNTQYPKNADACKCKARQTPILVLSSRSQVEQIARNASISHQFTNPADAIIVFNLA